MYLAGEQQSTLCEMVLSDYIIAFFCCVNAKIVKFLEERLFIVRQGAMVKKSS